MVASGDRRVPFLALWEVGEYLVLMLRCPWCYLVCFPTAFLIEVKVSSVF